jgi:hypothetical protein
MRLTLILTFLSFIYEGYSQPAKSSSLTTFIKQNYKIEYPGSWTLDTSGQLNSEFFVFSPLENDSDKFKENVSLIIQNLAGQNIDLNMYKQITEGQIAGLGSEAKLFESVKTRTAQGDYYSVRYALNRANFKLIVTSYCYIKDEKAYLITFTSESDKYKQFKRIGVKILDSFQFRR